MSKLDLRKYLGNKKGQKVNPFMYKFLTHFVMNPFLYAPMHCKIIDNVGVKNIKGPFLVLSNHTSRCDYLYVSNAFRPHCLNYVISYTEFYRAHMHGIFKVIKSIPKKNFTSDIHGIKEILQVLADGGNVVLFPEGKSSISGTNQPVMIGTGKLFKHTKVPVYTTTIRGGYMSNTQWNIANRPGMVEIEVNKLLDVEDIEKYTVEEIEDKVNKAIYNDDFAWNREKRVKFKGNDTVAVKLEEHLYWCPKCKKELTMIGEKNFFHCTNCGNGAYINEYYDLIPIDKDAVIPKDLRVWYELQRREIYRQIKNNPDFKIEENVKLGILPNDHYVPKTQTSEIVGEGKLTLTRSTFSFVGTKDGQPFEINESVLNVPSLVLETDSSYFGLFVGNEYYEFHPEHKVSTKWVLAAEECHRAAGGRWQNTLEHQQWIYEDDKETDKENYYI